MAPKKKKKPAANPARGFATVSVPSKPKDAPAGSEKEGSSEPSTPAETPQSGTGNDTSTTTNMQLSGGEKTLQQMSPDELDAYFMDLELQNMLDADSSKVKAEAARQTARLQNERRLLRSQAQPLKTSGLLLEALTESIFEINERYELRRLQVSKGSTRYPAEADETSLILKLWLLQLVLRSLKFSNISEAIEYVAVVSLTSNLDHSNDTVHGLPEIMEWYALKSGDLELPNYDTGMIRAIEDRKKEESRERTSIDEDHDTLSTLPADGSDRQEEILDDAGPSPQLSDIDSDKDYDPSELVERFNQYKTSLFKLDHRLRPPTKKPHPQTNARKRLLEHRIKSIEQDPLFDSRLANDIWRQNLRELTIEQSISERRDNNTTTLQKNVNPVVQDQSLSAQADVDENEESILGDMFATNEDTVNSLNRVTPAVSVHILDYGSWPGADPRKLLEDACRVIDARCVIRIVSLSSNSYSSRSKLDISWSQIRTIDDSSWLALPETIKCTTRSNSWVFEMISIATTNKQQSDAYLSTLALFLLSASDDNDQKAYIRLPKAFRELYKELSTSRKNVIHKRDKSDLAWIRQVVHDARSTVPETTETRSLQSQKEVTTLRNRSRPTSMRLGIDEAKALWATKSSSAAFAKMLEDRACLTVHSYKDDILNAIEHDKVVIICADTGAGKSTQVPSFILESNLNRGNDCKILVTQPRRISAISLARRVSQELGEPRNHLGTHQSLVGYAIRLESKTSEATRLTYATTGVLLRMLESDPGLQDLDYLILDEVHERTMDLDLLFIALLRLQERRINLKVVLMSATVDAQKFSRYFRNAPIFNVPGRTFPVEVYHLEDALEETQDINTHNSKAEQFDEDRNLSETYEDEEHMKSLIGNLDSYSSKTRLALSSMDEYRIDYELIAKLATAIATKSKLLQYSKAILIFMPGIGEIRQLQNLLLSLDTFSQGWIIHMLHSSFSTEDLEKAFAIPPRGYRKIVIATNIAETGITIPDVTAVIDTCKEKIMRFDERRQLSRLTEGFISRSSARQRRGRAARVQDGLCFHLVTRYRYENLMMEQHTPEMLRLSLQDPILRVKVWNLGSIEDTLAAAIDPPTAKNVRRAVEKLKDAGALDRNENLTPLGQILARLPLEVAMGKLAVFGIIFQCLESVVTMIAMLSSKSPFVSDRSGTRQDPRQAFSRGDSDLLSSFNAYEAWKKAKAAGSAQQFCKKHHLNHQSMLQIQDQKIQLLVYLVDAGLLSLQSDERTALNKARNSSNRKEMFDVPKRYDRLASDGMICAVIGMAFYPRVILREGKGYRNVYSNQQVSLGHSSINRASEKPPIWLCFYEAVQAKSGNLNVFETSRVPEEAIVLTMGDADFKLFSGIIAIDNGRLRFSLRHWKQMMALKILREAISGVLDRCFASHGLTVSPVDQLVIEEVAKALGGGAKGMKQF